MVHCGRLHLSRPSNELKTYYGHLVTLHLSWLLLRNIKLDLIFQILGSRPWDGTATCNTSSRLKIVKPYPRRKKGKPTQQSNKDKFKRYVILITLRMTSCWQDIRAGWCLQISRSLTNLSGAKHQLLNPRLQRAHCSEKWMCLFVIARRHQSVFDGSLTLVFCHVDSCRTINSFVELQSLETFVQKAG